MAHKHGGRGGAARVALACVAVAPAREPHTTRGGPSHTPLQKPRMSITGVSDTDRRDPGPESSPHVCRSRPRRGEAGASVRVPVARGYPTCRTVKSGARDRGRPTQERDLHAGPDEAGGKPGMGGPGELPLFTPPRPASAGELPFRRGRRSQHPMDPRGEGRAERGESIEIARRDAPLSGVPSKNLPSSIRWLKGGNSGRSIFLDF